LEKESLLKAILLVEKRESKNPRIGKLNEKAKTIRKTKQAAPALVLTSTTLKNCFYGHDSSNN
jgi:hypothetical protein